MMRIPEHLTDSGWHEIVWTFSRGSISDRQHLIDWTSMTHDYYWWQKGDMRYRYGYYWNWGCEGALTIKTRLSASMCGPVHSLIRRWSFSTNGIDILLSPSCFLFSTRQERAKHLYIIWLKGTKRQYAGLMLSNPMHPIPFEIKLHDLISLMYFTLSSQYSQGKRGEWYLISNGIARHGAKNGQLELQNWTSSSKLLPDSLRWLFPYLWLSVDEIKVQYTVLSTSFTSFVSHATSFSKFLEARSPLA